ncbi:MAG: hypothetical protein AB7P33_17860 [Dehalococcoidia bacterium]
MRLLLLGLFLAVASTACSAAKADTEPGRDYSGAFANWFYQTNEVSIEAGAVQAAIVEAHDDAGIRSRLRELATTQTSLNNAFASATPHPFWKDYHPAIVEAMRQFDDATAPFRSDEELSALAEVADVFKVQEDALLQIVINCYTQTKDCPK